MGEREYFPPPESRGGWRYLIQDDEVRRFAGMDPGRLALVVRRQETAVCPGDTWGLVIARRGYLVREHYTFPALVPTRFDIWSCTKSFTSTAYGLLLEDARPGALSKCPDLTVDSIAYDFIPEGHPLSDPRKARISLRHLLTMTAGIPGREHGFAGMQTPTGAGPFEYALGRGVNKAGERLATLLGEPGTVWNYSDASYAHLSLIFRRAADEEMGDFMQRRVFEPIGAETLAWDVQGGSGFLGPRTNGHTGIHICARDLARFGYLMLRGGLWEGERFVPAWWLEAATRSSQPLNPRYGLGWWVNSEGRMWPGLPRDAFAMTGYRSNRCYIIPSLDLVVARIGSGPTTWDEEELIGGIVSAIR